MPKFLLKITFWFFDEGLMTSINVSGIRIHIYIEKSLYLKGNSWIIILCNISNKCWNTRVESNNVKHLTSNFYVLLSCAVWGSFYASSDSYIYYIWTSQLPIHLYVSIDVTSSFLWPWFDSYTGHKNASWHLLHLYAIVCVA